ncbi:Sec-independent protein translocase subunit TatA [Populibacterium corticicola]|uniref:Sec-independent protein translocase protein TatA n=2 Tax=Populibacterium corticicola TaxID=1812826 RepID=A0ABW5XE63_9MICO
MPGMRSVWHWVLLIVVILLVFGSKKLPDIARSVGQSMKIFKKEIKELTDDDAPAQSNPAESVSSADTADTKRKDNA